MFPEGAFRQMPRRGRPDNQLVESLRHQFRKIQEFVYTHDKNTLNADLQVFLKAEREEQSTFLTRVSIRYQELLKQLTDKSKHNSAYQIANFWLSCFSAMISQMAKISQKNKAQVDEPRTIRKKWHRDELEIIKSALEQNKMDSNTLRRLSVEFNRSIASIQSKVQKLQKSGKDNEKDSYTLQKKLINILKQFPEGLTKEQVFGQLVKRYEMDEDNNWKKSAGQLLCSSKSIEKLKGTYGLLKQRNVNILHANSVKQKTIFCLMKAQNHRATLKELSEIYIQYFESDEVDEVRHKGIIGNLGRVVARYSCFDRSQVKTRYKYVQDKKSGESDQIQSQSDS